MSTNVDHVWRLQEGRSKYYKCAACGDVSAYFELPGECVEVMKAALSWYDNNWEETKRDHDLMLANLTATQARCTELLEEVRRLKTERPRIIAALRTYADSSLSYEDYSWHSIVDSCADKIERGEF